MTPDEPQNPESLDGAEQSPPKLSKAYETAQSLREIEQIDPEAAKSHPLSVIQDPKKRCFLEAYLHTGTVGGAARACKIGSYTHTHWLQTDPAYRRAYEWCKLAKNADIEDALYTRAVHGWKEPVWHQGEKVGYNRKYDNRLLMFLAKARMPETYGQRVQVTGAGGGPIQHAHMVAQLPPELLKRLADMVEQPEKRDASGAVVIDLAKLESPETTEATPQPDAD